LICNERIIFSKKINLPAEQIQRLESLDGWIWDISKHRWEQGFSHLQAFVKQEGHARVKIYHKISDGYSLGVWVSSQRRRKDKLTSEQINRLEALEGWIWRAR